MRGILVVLVVVLVVAGIYALLTPPPRPQVIVAKPQTQNTTSPAVVYPVSYTQCQGIYVRVGTVEVCGVESLSIDARGVVVTLNNGWVTGQVVFVYAPPCPVRIDSNRVVVPCEVTVLIPK